MRDFPLTLLAIIFFALPQQVFAQGATLPNGTTLSGRPIRVASMKTVAFKYDPQQKPVIFPTWAINAGFKRYYISNRLKPEIQLGDILDGTEFLFTHRHSGRQLMPTSLGGFSNVTPFSEHGRRIVTISSQGKPVDIIQGLSRITPRICEIEALDYRWEYGVATKTISPQVLQTILHQQAPANDIAAQRKIVRFFIELEQYGLAQQELLRLKQMSPDLETEIEQLQLELRGLQAINARNIVERLLNSGQYQLVNQALKVFPQKDIPETILDQLNQWQTENDQANEEIELVKITLAELQAQLTDENQREQIAFFRSIINEQINRDTLERFGPYLAIVNDQFLSAEQKLAIAYSGWVVGSAYAIENLRTTLNYWEARRLILEVLRLNKEDLSVADLLTQLENLENIGPDSVARIIQNLPPALAPLNVETGIPLQHASPPNRDGEGDVNYLIQLPPEYHPGRSYPVMIVLHDAGLGPQTELQWWTGKPGQQGPAANRGYIVIAPEYVSRTTNSYLPNALSHQAVLQSLRDASRRYSIDHDRVFLAGHGMGGTAVYDIALGQPGVFAGAIPIVGLCNDDCDVLWENGSHLNTYAVCGELDRDSRDINVRNFDRMLRKGHSMIICEYANRGYEQYYEEVEDIFNWMQLTERNSAPQEFEANVIRPYHRQTWWMEFSDLPAKILHPNNRKAMTVSAKITTGNVIHLRNGASKISVHLSPEFVDFTKPLKIKKNGRPLFDDIPERDIKTAITHLQKTGDRKNLVWQIISN